MERKVASPLHWRSASFWLPLNTFMLLWKHNLTIIFWVFLSPLWYSIYRPDKAIRVWSQSSCKNFISINQGHVKGEHRDSGQSKGQQCQHLSHELKKKKKKRRDVIQRQGGESERHCGRERHYGRQEKEHIYLRLPWCITSLSFPGKKKKKRVRWLINCPAHRRRREKSLP